MTTQNFISSLSTIKCNNGKAHHRSCSQLRYNKSEFIKIPYQQIFPLKFPKQSLRKQTEMNMHTQTSQNPQRSCIRNFSYANWSSINDSTQIKKPISRKGLFNCLSKESSKFTTVYLRTLEDFGAVKNRKKLVQPFYVRPNPITIGQYQSQHNLAYTKAWGEPRRHRDNGKQCSQTLIWKDNKNKSYLSRYRQKISNSRLQPSNLRVR